MSRLARLSRSFAQRWSLMLRLRRAVPTWQAIRVVSRTTGNRAELGLTLSSTGRRATVRANTSDLACLEQVFINEEYRLPVEANPAFAVRPRFIIDAGANIGMATLYFTNAFPEAMITAIEPEASNFALLQANCHGLGRVRLKHAALWPCAAALRLDNPSGGQWSFVVTPADEATTTVPAITIPGLLAESGLDRIDLLKLDIEGAERELFNDSCEEWLPLVGLIIIELHDRFAPGCSERFYSHLARRPFAQEVRGENVFISLGPPSVAGSTQPVPRLGPADPPAS